MLSKPPISTAVNELPSVMKAYERWTVSLFLISVAFHLFAFLVLHLDGHMVFPLTLNKHERFGDLTIFADKFPSFHSAAFFHTGLMIIYPPPIWVIFNFFFKYAGTHVVATYVTFSVLAFAIPAALFGKALCHRGIRCTQAVLFVSLLCLLSWPVELIVDGANCEVFVWLMMATAMWSYARNRLWIAAVCIGLAASLKLFPFVFLTLFLYRRHIGKLVVGALTFFLATVISLKFAGPTISIAWRGFLDGLRFARTTLFELWHVGEQGVDHSLFAGIKLFLLVAFRGRYPHYSEAVFSEPLHLYSLATAVGGGLLYFCFIRKLPLLNQILLLSIIAIYFTPFSGDGTLIHLYYPLAMMFLLAIRAHQDGVVIPGLSKILYCMVFCLSMESFVVIHYRGQSPRFIGTVHCVALGVMLVAGLRYKLGPKISGEPDCLVLSQPTTDWIVLGAAYRSSNQNSRAIFE